MSTWWIGDSWVTVNGLTLGTGSDKAQSVADAERRKGKKAKVQQPVAANGRKFIPQTAKAGKNRRTKRERLEILLRKDFLLHEEAETLRQLASMSNVPLKLKRIELQL